ncbi:MAG: hypothetical protein ACKO0N_16050, partial [Planctomycetota bacterium]
GAGEAQRKCDPSRLRAVTIPLWAVRHHGGPPSFFLAPNSRFLPSGEFMFGRAGDIMAPYGTDFTNLSGG